MYRDVVPRPKIGVSRRCSSSLLAVLKKARPHKIHPWSYVTQEIESFKDKEHYVILNVSRAKLLFGTQGRNCSQTVHTECLWHVYICTRVCCRLKSMRLQGKIRVFSCNHTYYSFPRMYWFLNLIQHKMCCSQSQSTNIYCQQFGMWNNYHRYMRARSNQFYMMCNNAIRCRTAPSSGAVSLLPRSCKYKHNLWGRNENKYLLQHHNIGS